MLEHNCGIVGVFKNDLKDIYPIARTMATAVQHRGQNGGGMVIKSENGLIKHSGEGLYREIFNPQVESKMNVTGLWGIGQTRYGTSGDWSEKNLQPCIDFTNNNSPVIVAHNGEFVNLNKPNDEIADTPVFTKMLAEAEGDTWEEKIIRVQSEARGAFSLIIGTDDSLYALRDQLGLRPLVLGKIKDGFVLASETHALDKVGAQIIKWLNPGEIIKIDKDGYRTIKEGTGFRENLCDFEWAYFSRPDSLLTTINNIQSILSFREKCGAIMAKRHKLKADFVVGVPDSGVALAIGYANQAKLPYRQAIVRDHFDKNGEKRIFLADSERHLMSGKVLGKLSLDPDRKNWENKSIIIGDDSCVRGTVAKEISKAVREMGVREINWIFGFPQIRHTCHLGVSMRQQEELIAHRNNGDILKIAKELGADGVYYISSEDLIKTRLDQKRIKLPKIKDEIFLKNGGCGGCVTGQYPVDKEGGVHVCCQNRFNLD